MIVLVDERGTSAWRAAHRGHITASDATAILARAGTQRQNELVERLVLDFEGHGMHTDEHPDPWAERHEEHLRAALAAYRRSTGYDVETTGFVTHDQYTWCGASPHGLVGSRGIVHFRVRQSIRSWHGRKQVTRADYARIYLTLYVTGRKWCDVVDFWDGSGLAPDKMRSQRVNYDPHAMQSGIAPRLIALWDRVRQRLRERATAQVDALNTEVL